MAPHSAPPPAPEVRAPPTVGTVVNRDRVALPGHRAAAGSRVISAEPARRWWEPTSSSPRPPQEQGRGDCPVVEDGSRVRSCPVSVLLWGGTRTDFLSQLRKF